MRLVINSKFKPFTYDEMVKPLVQYKEVFDKVEQDYTDLITQTEIWKDIANQENSPEAYAIYKQYSDKLNNLSKSFSNEGLKLGTRKSLLGMKRDYTRSIGSIAAADAARKESKKYRQDVLSKDSSAIFKTNPTSIDDFLHGKTPDETFVSGDKITARTAAKSEALGKALFSDPQFKEVLGKQQYQIMQANGATPEQLFKAISQDPDAIPYLSKIYKDEWDAVDANSFGANEQAAIGNAISTGMYAALAKPTYQYVANGEYIDAGRRAALALDQQRLSLDAQRLALAKQESANRQYLGRAALGEVPLRTKNHISYYTDGRTEQNALHNIYIDSNDNVHFKVKKGHTWKDSLGRVYNPGEVITINANNNPIWFMHENYIDVEPVPGNESFYGPEVQIVEKEEEEEPADELETTNAGLK